MSAAVLLLAYFWVVRSPGLLLIGLVALSLLASLVEGAARRRRRRALRDLAARWQMTYSPRDPLRVRDKVVGRLPVPGAADLYVTDVIYGGEGELYRYIFTVEYTLGAVRRKRRDVRVGTFAEPRTRKGDEAPGPVTLAPAELPVLAQYKALQPQALENGTSL